MASRRPPAKSTTGSAQRSPVPAVAAASVAASASDAAKAATQAVPRKKPRTHAKSAASSASAVSAEQRHAMIAEGAYLRAERRGFVGGNEVSDWVAAEREVDELLSADVTNSAQ